MPRTFVVHFHELWLKGGNRNFFLAKLLQAVRRSLEPLTHWARVAQSRILVDVPDESIEAAVERLRRVFGIAYFASARRIEERDPAAIFAAAWEEVRGRAFDSFAVRAKRADKEFPLRSSEIERELGAYLLERLRAAGHPGARVNLGQPGITCFVEVTRRATLIYSEKQPGAGGMPPNTAGRLMALLSGGYDSVVASYKMMRRGAHLSFAHFHGSPARPGESSVPVARDLARLLTPLQFTTRLFLVPFESIQRQIVIAAPEPYRILLYRRMMLRIAERLARRDRAFGLVTGDSLAQVASQTLQNLSAIDRAAVMPVFRPLIGDDKLDILQLAHRIGSYATSSEPFQDCCPLFLPRAPSLYTRPEDLDAAERSLDVEALVKEGVDAAVLEKYEYRRGEVTAIPVRVLEDARQRG